MILKENSENRILDKIVLFCLQVSDLNSAERSLQEHSREGNITREQGESKDGDDEGADWELREKVESYDWPEERVCHTHERAIPIQETVEALDITEEG